MPVDYYSGTVLYHIAINILEIRRQHDFRFSNSSFFALNMMGNGRPKARGTELYLYRTVQRLLLLENASRAKRLQFEANFVN